MDYQLLIKKENIQFRKQNEYKWIMFAVSMFYICWHYRFYSIFFFPIGWFLLYFFFFHTSAHFNQVWNFQVPPKTPITLKAVDSVSPPKKNTLVLHKFKIHTRAKYHATKTIPVSQSFDSETYLFFSFYLFSVIFWKSYYINRYCINIFIN